MKSSDKYNNSKGFLPSKSFHHFSIVVSNLPLNFALIIIAEPELNVYGKRSSEFYFFFQILLDI